MTAPGISWQDFYSLQSFGITSDLNNIRLFCRRLGNPEQAFPAIHVGGTNGKGTVTALIESILRSAGLRTGMYTSPHILRFEERIAVDGQPIREGEVFEFLEEHWGFIQDHHCTFFETATAMALDYFRRSNVEIAVVEVGLGGTYDCTAVINAILSIVTRIDLDHTERLGISLEQIAADKAGIFRRGYPALTFNQRPEVSSVLKTRAGEVGAPLVLSEEIADLSSLSISPHGISGTADLKKAHTSFKIDHWKLPLTGFFQTENLQLTLAACCLLMNRYPAINPDAILRGISTVAWPGRLQILGEDPVVVLDVGHNPGAVQSSLQSVLKIWNPKRLSTIFSALRDKDVVGMMNILKEESDSGFVVPLPPPRGLTLEEIVSLAEKTGWNAIGVPCATDALSLAVKTADPDDVIFIVGSHYLAEEVLKKQEFS